MIDLTLRRITALAPPTPWPALHITGTNGKGSISAYLTSILCSSSLRTGTFTSPHLLYRHDSILINNRPISAASFLAAELFIKQRNLALRLDATEFEILTATAFELFNREAVQVGVVECGMGGARDATNCLANPLVAVVGKVGLDHTGFLGGSVQEIAKEKSGVVKGGMKAVVVDGSNLESVVKAVRRKAAEENVPVNVARPVQEEREEGCEIETEAWGRMRFPSILAGAFQKWNLACAVGAAEKAADVLPGITKETVLEGVAKTRWPGRLDWVDVGVLLDKQTLRKVLVDGAHNAQAAEELRKYVDSKVRRESAKTVTWVLAASKGKDVEEMVRILVKRGDRVIATRFGKVDGMPWVEATDPELIRDVASEVLQTDQMSEMENLDAVVRGLNLAGDEGNVVIAGSLYLVGELLRQIHERKGGVDNSIGQP